MNAALVPKEAKPITDEAMLEIMIQTLPIHLHDVKDMRKLINKLWPVLVNTFEIKPTV